MIKINKNFLMVLVVFSHFINYGMENQYYSIGTERSYGPQCTKKFTQLKLNGLFKNSNKIVMSDDESYDNFGFMMDISPKETLDKIPSFKLPESRDEYDDIIDANPQLNERSMLNPLYQQKNQKFSDFIYKNSMNKIDETLNHKTSMDASYENPNFSDESFSHKNSRKECETSRKESFSHKASRKECEDSSNEIDETLNDKTFSDESYDLISIIKKKDKLMKTPEKTILSKRKFSKFTDNDDISNQIKIKILSGSNESSEVNSIKRSIKCQEKYDLKNSKFWEVNGSLGEQNQVGKSNPKMTEKNSNSAENLTQKDMEFLENFKKLNHSELFQSARNSLIRIRLDAPSISIPGEDITSSEMFSPQEEIEFFMEELMDIIKNIFQSVPNKSGSLSDLFQCFTKHQSMEIQKTLKIVRKFISKVKFENIYNNIKNILNRQLSDQKIEKINDLDVMKNRRIFFQKKFGLKDNGLLKEQDQEELRKVDELNKPHDFKEILREAAKNTLKTLRLELPKRLPKDMEIFIESFIDIIKKYILGEGQIKHGRLSNLLQCFTKNQRIEIKQTLKIIIRFFPRVRFSNIFENIRNVLNHPFLNENIGKINDQEVMAHRKIFLQKIHQKIFHETEIIIIKKEIVNICDMYILNPEYENLLNQLDGKKELQYGLIFIQLLRTQNKNISMITLSEKFDKLLEEFKTEEDKKLMEDLTNIIKNIFQNLRNDRNSISDLLECLNKKQSIAVKQILEIVKGFFPKITFANIHNNIKLILSRHLSDEKIEKINDQEVIKNRKVNKKNFHGNAMIMIKNELMKIFEVYNPEYQTLLNNLDEKKELKYGLIFIELLNKSISINSILSKKIHELLEEFITEEDKKLMQYLTDIIKNIFQNIRNDRNSISDLLECFKKKQFIAIKQILKIIKSLFPKITFLNIHNNIRFILIRQFSDEKIEKINDQEAIKNRKVFFAKSNKKNHEFGVPALRIKNEKCVPRQESAKDSIKICHNQSSMHNSQKIFDKILSFSVDKIFTPDVSREYLKILNQGSHDDNGEPIIQETMNPQLLTPIPINYGRYQEKIILVDDEYQEPVYSPLKLEGTEVPIIEQNKVSSSKPKNSTFIDPSIYFKKKESLNQEKIKLKKHNEDSIMVTENSVTVSENSIIVSDSEE
jgi:hypothetical protein